MKTVNKNPHAPQGGCRIMRAPTLHPAEPLWKRAPTRDEYGRPLSDFMMLIPGLGRQPAQVLQETVARIEAVLAHYERSVVFADLNLKMNVLWVTVRPVPGICLELPTAINLRVPEAKLVAHKLSAD